MFFTSLKNLTRRISPPTTTREVIEALREQVQILKNRVTITQSKAPEFCKEANKKYKALEDIFIQLQICINSAENRTIDIQEFDRLFAEKFDYILSFKSNSHGLRVFQESHDLTESERLLETLRTIVHTTAQENTASAEANSLVFALHVANQRLLVLNNQILEELAKQSAGQRGSIIVNINDLNAKKSAVETLINKIKETSTLRKKLSAEHKNNPLIYFMTVVLWENEHRDTIQKKQVSISPLAPTTQRMTEALKEHLLNNACDHGYITKVEKEHFLLDFNSSSSYEAKEAFERTRNSLLQILFNDFNIIIGESFTQMNTNIMNAN